MKKRYPVDVRKDVSFSHVLTNVRPSAEAGETIKNVGSAIMGLTESKLGDKVAEGGKMTTGYHRCGFKEELLNMLLEKSFQFSEEPTFRLVSGTMSQFYINCRPTVLDPRGMFLAGNLYFDAVSDIENLAGVGGLTFGADPIAVATAYTSEVKGQPIKAFSIRKEQKTHGIVKWIEGDMSPGDRVAIIDDVATTGGSTIKAIERAQVEGLQVVRVVILVDRQEGGIENIKKHIPDVRVIFTRTELFSAYQLKKCQLK